MNKKSILLKSIPLVVIALALICNGNGQNTGINTVKSISDGKLKIEQTTQLTNRISWAGGHLDLNLVPMNVLCEKSSGMAIGFSVINDKNRQGQHDEVGIVGLQLDGSSQVPRIVWDNREHQFWDGYDGAFEPRNTVVNKPLVVYANADSTQVDASYYYISNYVKTTEEWNFKAPVKPALATWDVHITVQNMNQQTLKHYFALFACYHPADTNFYWGEGNKIMACSQGSFNATANKDVETILKASPVDAHIKRYIADWENSWVQFYHPVLMSQIKPWYGGMRHVIMVEPTKCASLVTWGHQARDYMIRPENWDLQPKETFSVTIRHVIAPVNSVKDLEKLWADFEKDMATQKQ